jgi:trans-aconitate methyltransferase
MEWNPEDYARNSGGQLIWARELIARLRLKGNETILDVGCGDGKVTAELAAAVPEGRVVGVDSSPAFVKYARDHYGNRPNLLFETTDARRLDLPAVFDIVFSNAALHWVDDHRSFLAGCAQAL